MAARIHPPLLAALLLIGAASAPAAAAGGAAEKVDVGLYYESLCPYSARFVVDHLAKVFEDDGLLEACNVTFFPYGNARAAADGTIRCQHGPDECFLNTVEGCAIETWPNTKDHFRFIYCVESLVVKRNYKEWKSCFGKLGFDPNPVTECYESEHGHQLQLKYKDQTDALEPPHKYVPWVVVNGKPLLEDYENVIAYICAAYKGPPPEACKKAELGRRHQRDAGNGVSYKSGEIKLKHAEDENAGEVQMVLPDDDN